MKCFRPSAADKRDEPKAVRSNSAIPSSSSMFPEYDLKSASLKVTAGAGAGGLKEFTFAELKEATRKFNVSSKIGEGGFGSVYKGTLKLPENPSTKIDVAIKQLTRTGHQGHKEWVTEVNMLGVVEHENLVKLIGYCAEDGERGIQRLLVYEYMPNRSVDNHLSAKFGTRLSWAARLTIARDAARGLAFLHEGMDFQIIFRDFKSSNILLDEQWKAKLSDFGLARLGPSEGLTHVSTAVVGTMGYASPEYIQTGHLTSKHDVWSYGMFLYELITGRRPLDRSRPKNEQKLLEWVKPYTSASSNPSKFHKILDPWLEGGDFLLISSHKLSLIANRCLVKHPKSRPTMAQVLEMVNDVHASGMGVPAMLRCRAEEDGTEKWSGKRRTMNRKVLEGGWLVKMWSLKRAKMACRYGDDV